MKQMLSVSEQFLVFPIDLWVDHILPILPLQTIVSVTTSLNKKSRDEFSKYKETIWEKYIDQQHPYLKAITRACEKFGTGDGDLSWFEYIKYCQDVSKDIEYDGSEVTGNQGLRQGYRLAYKIGRSHYILKMDKTRLQASALHELRANMFKLKSSDYKYFIDRETKKLKDQDVFNTYGIFISMFDPAFSALYIDASRKLKSITKFVEAKLREQAAHTTQESVDSGIDLVLNMFNQGLKNINLAFRELRKTERECCALRYIMRLEKVSTFEDFDSAFVVLSELLNRLGYQVNTNMLVGTKRREGEVSNTFVFQLLGDSSVCYYVSLNRSGFYHGSFDSNDIPEWYSYGLERHSDASNFLIQHFIDALIPSSFFDMYESTQDFERYNVNEFFIKSRNNIFSTLHQNQYGLLSFPPLSMTTPVRMHFGFEIAEETGQFAITSKNIAVIIGRDEDDGSYFCLSMLNEVFIEDSVNIIFKNGFDDERIKVLRGVFKYNTYIGGYFESFKDGKYIGYTR